MAIVEVTGQYGSLGSGSSGVLNTDRRLFGDPNTIAELTTAVAPFTSFLNARQREKVSDPDFKWFEHRGAWRDTRRFFIETAISCTSSNSATAFTNISIETTAGSNDAVPWLRAGDQIRVTDGGDNSLEAGFLVTNVDSTTQVDLKLMASDPGFNIVDGDAAIKIGSSFEEGAGKTSALQDEVETLNGSTQIFKELVSITGTLEELELRGQVDEANRLRGEALDRLHADVERTLLFGERIGGAVGATVATGSRITDLDGTHPFRSSVGLQQVIKGGAASRILDKSYNAYSYENWIDDSKNVFFYNDQDKTLLGLMGLEIYSFFSAKMPIRNGLLNISNSENKFGLKVITIETPQGSLSLFKHKLMTQEWDDFGFIIDPSEMVLRVYRDLTMQDHVETPGTDGREDQWMWDVGLQPKLVEKHSLIRMS